MEEVEEIEFIEAGEWVRTQDGQISKNNSNYDWDIRESSINDSPIINHSKNIIDLIEKGDYVNGFIVRAKDEKNIYWDFLKKSFPAKIGNIVTKEQFSKIRYVFED